MSPVGQVHTAASRVYTSRAGKPSQALRSETCALQCPLPCFLNSHGSTDLNCAFTIPTVPGHQEEGPDVCRLFSAGTGTNSAPPTKGEKRDPLLNSYCTAWALPGTRCTRYGAQQPRSCFSQSCIICHPLYLHILTCFCFRTTYRDPVNVSKGT